MSTPVTIPPRYGDGLSGRSGALPGAGLPWLQELRAQAWERFAATGLPGQKQEAWRYTNTRPLRDAELTPATALSNGIALDGIPGRLPAPAARMVFVNGFWRADLSDTGDLPADVSLMSLAQILAGADDKVADALHDSLARDEAPLAALNGALMQDGYVLTIASNARVQAPIELLFVHLGHDAVEYHGRHLIVAGSNSEAQLFERHIDLGGNAYFANHALTIEAAPGAQLSRCKLQAEGREAMHVATTRIEVSRDARVNNLELTTGAALSRSEIGARLLDRGGELRLDGAYLLRGRQHGDTTTWIEHCAGQTSSNEVYKGVLDDHARGVFQGRITVRPDAQGIAGHQLNKTLLLSDDAEIDTKPELEIFADDVKCSHGATAGELDDDALFYMRSRGVPEAEARGLLIRAFIEDALAPVSQSDVRGILELAIDTWLEANEGDGSA